MCDLYVVTVDTRGKSSSDIKGYQEHVCSRKFFQSSIADHPDATCYTSELGKLCGLDLKIYFHNGPECNNAVNQMSLEHGVVPKHELNRAASLLTLDPETGFAQYHVRGIAYVLLNDGLAPLSYQQVWGLQELANYATDVYKSDPEHAARGKRDLLRSCKQYRNKIWGPLAIYKSRPESLSGGASTVVPPSVISVKAKSPLGSASSIGMNGVDHRSHQKTPTRYAIK